MFIISNTCLKSLYSNVKLIVLNYNKYVIIDMNNFADKMKKIMKLLQNEMIYAQVLQK